ncbi:MAG: DEAD/DEAH box helicase family protein [Bacilli bacterium]|nr:DEAD/DEAH box helicase family protein [Bacilli bacterium]MBQ8218754.1 DEAD/DEAH box helicase family protein [Bacilli bacterium]
MIKVEKLRLKTYNEAVKQLKKYGKCAIIRPTGFGKTGILTKFIKSNDYKKILYLYPAEVIKNTVLDFYYEGTDKKDTIDNVIFMTYMALTNLSETDLKKLEGVDLIICDECHRLGATETMRGMQDLMSLKSRPHILGATATPERMDMIDEIALFFDDRVTSKYTFHDAIKDGIIQKPYYVYCDYRASDPKLLSRIKKEAMLNVTHMNNRERQNAIDIIEAKIIEISKLFNMETIIAETLKETNTDTTYQKYIVFFSDFAHMRKAKRNVKKWFKAAFPNHRISELIISSETPEYSKNVEKLDKLHYKENKIDLIYTCEMLNMGYHVADLTGILMYRGTHSGIVYSQQLGRAISSGDTKPKIVFDIVDNIHRHSEYSILGEHTKSNKYLTEEEVLEYKELVNRTRDRDENNNPIPLTEEEMSRFIELSKKMKRQRDEKLGKINNNVLYPEDLVATKYAATYREIIAKTVAEAIDMRCRQAWTRWIEKGGDPTIMKRTCILGQEVPLEKFCKLKNVTVNKVLDVMGVVD